MGKYSENYKNLYIKRNGVVVILPLCTQVLRILWLMRSWARSVIEQHLIQHPVLPNTKCECEVCQAKPNPISWFKSRDGRLGGRFPPKRQPQPGVSTQASTMQLSEAAGMNAPPVAPAHGQRLDTLVRGDQLGSAASRDAAAVIATTHLPHRLGAQDKGTIQWDSNV